MPATAFRLPPAREPAVIGSPTNIEFIDVMDGRPTGRRRTGTAWRNADPLATDAERYVVRLNDGRSAGRLMAVEAEWFRQRGVEPPALEPVMVDFYRPYWEALKAREAARQTFEQLKARVAAGGQVDAVTRAQMLSVERESALAVRAADWMALGVRPFANALAGLLGGQAEVTGPSGLAARCGVAITMPGGDLYFELEGLGSYDPGRWTLGIVDITTKVREYEAGSLGALNGLGYGAKELPPGLPLDLVGECLAACGWQLPAPPQQAMGEGVDARYRDTLANSVPMAAEGLISYRCKGRYGWIMIGAIDHEDALREARRSHDGATMDGLQVWNGTCYEPVAHERDADLVCEP